MLFLCFPLESQHFRIIICFNNETLSIVLGMNGEIMNSCGCKTNMQHGKWILPFSCFQHRKFSMTFNLKAKSSHNINNHIRWPETFPFKHLFMIFMFDAAKFVGAMNQLKIVYNSSFWPVISSYIMWKVVFIDEVTQLWMDYIKEMCIWKLWMNDINS